MDVGELLAFQPDKPNVSSKRKNVDTLEEGWDAAPPPPKQRAPAPPVAPAEMSAEEQERILQMVEEEAEGEAINDTTLKKLLLNLEKKVYRNQEQRIKFPDLPEKMHFHCVAAVLQLERLMELHFKHLDKLLRRAGEEVDEEQEDEFYMKRLDAGLFTLQLLDYIMLEACASGPPSIKPRVMQILNMRGGSIKSIRNIMREYAGNIGDAKDKEAREMEQSRILQLVDKF